MAKYFQKRNEIYDDMEKEPSMEDGYKKNNKKKRKFSVKEEPHSTGMEKGSEEIGDSAHKVPKDDRKRMAIAVMSRKMGKKKTSKM